MKILYLITKSELGGAQTHVAQLCGYFSGQGAKIGVMSFPGGWLESEVKKYGVKFYPNEYFSNSPNPLKIWLAAKKIKVLVDNFNPDIVHCHGSAAGVLGRMVVRGRVKTIFTAHGWSFNIGVPLWQKIFGVVSEKICGFYTTKIIAVCNFVRDYGVKYHVAPKEKFQVIYNGIEALPDSNGFDSGKHESTGALKNRAGKIKLVFLGRLASPKDPLLLLDAIAKSKVKDLIELSIIGSGPKESDVKKRIKSLGLTQVKLLGSLPRQGVFDILKQSDIFVLTTNWEGFPYAILEAMSCALPVIATNVGGVSELVNSETGILVKNSDREDLVVALEKLCLDKERIKSMGLAAKKLVAEKFLLQKMFSETDNIYKCVIKNIL